MRRPPVSHGFILLAPLIFAVHVAEEAPRFVAWFNRQVQPNISQALFMSVNAGAFIVTVLISFVAFNAKSRASLLLLIAWLGFLFVANALFHIAGTVYLTKYSPGLVTAVFLYLPYFFFLCRFAVQQFRVKLPVLLSVTALAGLPMLVHGYLIVFEGKRLF